MSLLSTLRAVSCRLSDALRMPKLGTGLRIVFVANADIPTLQICFTRPLRPLVESGKIISQLVTEEALKQRAPALKSEATRRDWMVQEVFTFKPDLIVFCRYSGPYTAALLAEAKRQGTATIYHLDDDLLAIPKELGEKKYAFHNAPERLESVRNLLDGTDLVYCSTAPLRQRLLDYEVSTPIIAGALYCPSTFQQNPPTDSKILTIGYMGFDHAHDFELALPALIETLDAYSNTKFELFGSIPKPATLDRFGTRVTVVPPVQGYERFMQTFADQHWDIGICPLVDTPFNNVKTNAKWVEYSSVGTAVVASGGTIYDNCCAEGCGLLATDTTSWRVALARLIEDAGLRHQLVANAQTKLEHDYTINRLRAQVLEVFEQALPASKKVLIASCRGG